MRRLPFHVFLFTVYPILFLYSYNVKQLTIDEITIPLIFVILASLLMWTVLGLILRNSLKSGLITTLFFIMFFIYGHVIKAMGGYYFFMFDYYIGSNKILIPIWTILFICVSFIILRTKRSLVELTRILNIAGLLLVGLNAGIIGFALFSGERDSLKEDLDIPPVNMPNTLPDIYCIVVDAYAGADVLKDLYGYDNSQFLQFLEDKGFYVANRSWSNYCYSELSLASLLNMNYLDSLASQHGLESLNVQQARQLIENSFVSKFLKHFGYTYVAFSSGYSLTEITRADIIMSPNFTLTEFQSIIINATPIPPILRRVKSLHSLHRDRILYTLDNMPKPARANSPVFVFAHIMAPHSPFVFGRNGEAVNRDQRFTIRDGQDFMNRQGTLDEYIKGYCDQLTFMNKKLQRMINEILSTSLTPPAILLVSDHGPRSRFNWDHYDSANANEGFGNLNALYLPVKPNDSLYEELSLVNDFRVLFNTCFGTKYQLLEDRSYFSPNDSHFDFYEIPKL